MDVVAFIFARGGSKGVPRKNLCPLAGRPLLAHAIDAAHGSRHVSRVIVSTEDDEIADAARRYGAETPFRRPAELALDASPEALAWRHAALAVRDAGSPMEVFVSVPPTAPLRLPADIDACIEAYLDDPCDCVLTVAEARANPYFSMLALDERGYARFAIAGKEGLAGRQQAPRVYDMTPVAYVADPEFVVQGRPLLCGRVRAVLVPRERAVDIDSPIDLEFAEFLLSRRGGAAQAPARKVA